MSSGNHLTTLFGTDPAIVEQTSEEKLGDTVHRYTHPPLTISPNSLAVAWELGLDKSRSQSQLKRGAELIVAVTVERPQHTTPNVACRAFSQFI